MDGAVVIAMLGFLAFAVAILAYVALGVAGGDPVREDFNHGRPE
jgi:hypothetical protein